MSDDRLRGLAREACGQHPDFTAVRECRCDVILAALEQAQEEYRLNTTVWTHASPVSKEEADELQDILRTLTNSGTALKTSARELVAALKAKQAEVERLTKERDGARRMQKIADGFHDVAVKERDLERLRVERLRADLEVAESRKSQVIRDLKADAERLADLLDEADTVLDGLGDPPGTSIRVRIRAALAAHEEGVGRADHAWVECREPFSALCDTGVCHHRVGGRLCQLPRAAHEDKHE